MISHDRDDMEQLIYTGNEYKLVSDADSANVPLWPVQDEGAHWHYEQFEGQMVCFRGSCVHFGFQVEEVPESEMLRDENGELNINDLFVCNNSKIWRAT